MYQGWDVTYLCGGHDSTPNTQLYKYFIATTVEMYTYTISSINFS